MLRLFQLKISKTGSTSMAELIRQRLPAEQVCHHRFQYAIEADPAHRLADYCFILGHIDLDFIERNVPGIQVVTLMREPRARVLSAYFRWRERAEERNLPLHETSELAGRLSLEDYLGCGHPAIRRSVWNFQARLLAGGHWGKDHHRHQQVFGPDLSGPEIVDRAKATLDRIAFVGLTERMDESASRLFDMLGWPQPGEVPHVNVTTRKDSVITQRAEELLSEYTELDQAVYAHAVRRFGEKAR
jgi:hypothetical protein